MVSPVNFVEKELPIHPYLLGCLIGDGNIRCGSPHMSSADQELIDRISDFLPGGVHIVKKRYSKYDWDIISKYGMNGGHFKNPVVDALEDLGIWGCGSENKFIPDGYKYSNIDTRTWILQGLMDTDGTVWKSRGNSVLEYCTVSKTLAEDFLFIVQSLGGKGVIRTKKTNKRLAYRITPAFPNEIKPFLLSRKAAIHQERTKYLPHRSIVSVEKIGPMDMTCIKVDAEDGLFVAENFIVTHNTIMQLSCADEICKHTGGNALLVAPLSVSKQTHREGHKFGIESTICRKQEDVKPGINITNYEMLDHFDCQSYVAVIIDESGILKHFSSKTRNQIIDSFRDTKYKLACSATPAPNDFMEIGNHAEFVGAMSRTEMLSMFFVHDSGDTAKWRLKKHAQSEFWKWVCTWAVMLRMPSDLGYDDNGFILPPLNMHQHVAKSPAYSNGELFPGNKLTLNDRRAARRDSIDDRAEIVKQLVDEKPNDQWLIWCNLNTEADKLEKLLPDAIGVRGADSDKHKEQTAIDFADGKVNCLISKASIYGHGMNWQSCHKMILFGLSDCYDEKTEVLTDDGWLSFGKINNDMLLATVNPETLAMEYQKPSKIVWQQYDGPMLHFKEPNGIDLLVTPNHKLLVQYSPNRHPSRDSGWQLKYASDIKENFKRQEYRMLSAPLSSTGDIIQSVDIPAYGRISLRSVTIKKIEITDFLKLAGWYLSEGYCRPLDSQERGRIVISQTDRNPENRIEIIELLTSIGLSVNHKTKDITGYSINLASYLIDQFGAGSYNLHIPAWIKNLHPSLLIILYETMLKGDGSFSGVNFKYYRSASERLANDFQEIALKLGIKAMVRYRVYTSKQYPNNGVFDVCLNYNYTHPSVCNHPVDVDYSGMIGCATVPNHTLIVRRNGTPIVSGNSFEEIYQAIRRCWRYGQKHSVDVHVIISDQEGAVLDNIKRKETDFEEMQKEMVANMADINSVEIKGIVKSVTDYDPKTKMEFPSFI